MGQVGSFNIRINYVTRGVKVLRWFPSELKPQAITKPFRLAVADKIHGFSMSFFPKLAAAFIALPVLFIFLLSYGDKRLNPTIDVGKFIAGLV